MDVGYELREFAENIDFPFEDSKAAAIKSLRVALRHLWRYAKEDEQDEIDEYLEEENGSIDEEKARSVYLLAVELKKRHDAGEPKEEI